MGREKKDLVWVRATKCLGGVNLGLRNNFFQILGGTSKNFSRNVVKTIGICLCVWEVVIIFSSGEGEKGGDLQEYVSFCHIVMKSDPLIAHRLGVCLKNNLQNRFIIPKVMVHQSKFFVSVNFLQNELCTIIMGTMRQISKV